MTLYDVEIAYDLSQTWADVIDADDLEDAEYKARQAFNQDFDGEVVHNVVVESIKEVKKQ